MSTRPTGAQGDAGTTRTHPAPQPCDVPLSPATRASKLLLLLLTGVHLSRPAAALRVWSAPPLRRCAQWRRATPAVAVATDATDARIDVTEVSAPGIDSAWDAWPRTWVPLASTFELDPERPTPVMFLGRRFVVWRDGEGEWRVFDDSCPHRLVPLSEGRIDRATGRLECAYHGWQFGGDGSCLRIPQLEPAVEAAACASARSCARTRRVLLEKGLIFVWPWKGEPPANPPTKETPAHMMAKVPAGARTYTRDLPYGWDTLVENLIDPGHVPFAHHGMQGKREDAIPINMSRNIDISAAGFSFDFADRTMGLRRAGTGEFRAPYVVAYQGVFEKKPGAPPGPPRTFNLTVVCVPRDVGRSRAFVFAGGGSDADKEADAVAEGTTSGTTSPPPKRRRKKSMASRISAAIPVWLSHLLSGRFLDSDLAFLHYQEQETQRLGGLPYFMPAPADRPIAALRTWIPAYAAPMGPLPPPLMERERLLNRWEQHGQHCVHCCKAIEGLGRWRRNTFVGLGASVLLGWLWPARVVGAGCVLLLYALTLIKKQFYFEDFKHYQNH